MTDEREALDKARWRLEVIVNAGGLITPLVLELADAYAAAERLDEHVKTCCDACQLRRKG